MNENKESDRIFENISFVEKESSNVSHVLGHS
jgi:hypothetical protein